MFDMLTDLGRFTQPMLSGIALANTFGSNPNYDEARGPRDPYGEGFVPVDEIEDGGWDLEDPDVYLDRIFCQDPDDPLGPGETENMVRKSMLETFLVATVDPDYEPNCGPAKVATRLFTSEEVLPAKAETIVVPIRVFDKKARRFVKISPMVTVHVRHHRKMAPH